jgi:Mg2+-importing ATPase
MLAVFHTGWFVESLWSQTLVIHMIRTPKILFTHSRASWHLALLTTLGIATGGRRERMKVRGRFDFVSLFVLYTKAISYILSYVQVLQKMKKYIDILIKNV